MTPQIAKQITATIGDNAMSTPKPVATPRPPLKPRNTDQLCPIMAKMPPRIMYMGFKWENKNTPMAPFNASQKNTGSAAFKPITRYVFVAPIFLDPYRRTSVLKNNLPIMSPLGIEPIT